MNILTYIFRSLSYYRRTHLWVALGTAVSTAIIVGALITGDSIRYSLRQIVTDRLGTTQFALTTGERFLHTRMAAELAKQLQTPVAPLMLSRGIVVVDGGKNRINNVQVVGVDRRFGEIGGVSEMYERLSADEVVVNDRLAARLQLHEGNEILLRLEKIDPIPRDIPLALDTETSFAKRYTIKAITGENEFSRFNLKADQTAPYTVFISLDELSREMGQANTCNTLLVADNSETAQSVDDVQFAFRDVWRLSDSDYEWVRVPDTQQLELRTSRIFMDDTVVNAILRRYEDASQIFTYFANEIRAQERATPYSFVSALSDVEMGDDEIIVNKWLADDLRAQTGDWIDLTYYVLGPSRTLTEATTRFRIKTVAPITGLFADESLMPDYPGLSDADNCRDWSPGIPIDLDKIRDIDEEYWDNYRGIPKAFISMDAAKKMWKNRYGVLTAIRIPNVSQEGIEEELAKVIGPGDLGFVFRDVKTEGLLASSQSVDFAQLFLGLSFFIILSALLLTGILYVFTVEQRAEQHGLFAALGFTKTSIKRILFIEGTALVIIGSVLGGICGVLYNNIIVIALKTVWLDVVGTSALQNYISVMTVLKGMASGIIINLLTLRIVTRHQLKQPIANLQRGITRLGAIEQKKSKWSLVICCVCYLGVAVLLGLAQAGRGHADAAYFFMAGFLLLSGSIALVNLLSVTAVPFMSKAMLRLSNLGVRYTVRKRFRSLALVGLLSSGLFIVFTVGANRHSALKNAEYRESGTGGFALIGETVMPILYDLNSERGRSHYALQEMTEDIQFVSFRVKEGDDASCLNLNRVSNPQLIGVNSGALSERGSFTFAQMADDGYADKPWDMLNAEYVDNIVPGIADQTVIQWGLGKSVGDTLLYRDESGGTVKVLLVGGLANSVLQGNIIIADNRFRQMYPSISGARLFLIDAPFAKLESISQKLSWALQDQGLDVTPAHARLQQYAQVENTYLSIFMILGALGLMIGSIGIGIVIWRNVAERRGELALLRSIGFSKKAIQVMLTYEHAVLVCIAVFIGLLSAVLATLPALLTPGANIPIGTVALLITGVVLNCGICIWWATAVATKHELLPALRNE